MAQTECELCSSANDIKSVAVAGTDLSVILCLTCREQVTGDKPLVPGHWQCLRDSMWSDALGVKVLAWRLLHGLQQKGESWAAELLEQLYLEDDQLALARAAGIGQESASSDNGPLTRDSNGNQLMDGDSVTLIKDLEVKGAGFTAKRGTLVKNISLTSNPEQIEGRVNGTQIVLLTKFLKKA